MHCEGILKLRLYNTSCCLIEVVTKAGPTINGIHGWHCENRVTYHSSNVTYKLNSFKNGGPSWS